MINVLNVKIDTKHHINRELYITLRSKQATHVSRVIMIVNEVCEWKMQEDCIVLDREQCNNAMVLELWDYNLRELLGKHSIVRLRTDDSKKSVYNGFFIGLTKEEVRLSVTYQSLAEGITSEKVKGKQTKRTESTNRESNNSLTNVIEQTGSSNHLYKSLIHSLSERNITQYKASQPQGKLYKFSPKNSQLLAKYNRQIL